MTRDYYKPQYGTLDVIVYTVANHFMLHPQRLMPGAASLDQICLHNARVLLDSSISSARIMFAIGKLCGLHGGEARQAYNQIVESYGE